VGPLPASDGAGTYPQCRTTPPPGPLGGTQRVLDIPLITVTMLGWCRTTTYVRRDRTTAVIADVVIGRGRSGRSVS
jgi:hypothetical protein